MPFSFTYLVALRLFSLIFSERFDFSTIKGSISLGSIHRTLHKELHLYTLPLAELQGTQKWHLRVWEIPESTGSCWGRGGNMAPPPNTHQKCLGRQHLRMSPSARKMTRWKLHGLQVYYWPWQRSGKSFETKVASKNVFPSPRFKLLNGFSVSDITENILLNNSYSACYESWCAGSVWSPESLTESLKSWNKNPAYNFHCYHQCQTKI